MTALLCALQTMQNSLAGLCSGDSTKSFNMRFLTKALPSWC